MDFKQADERLGTRDSRKLQNNTYLQRRGDDAIAVKLHDTDVVTFYRDGRTVLDSGGWRTLTTRARMNVYAPGMLYQERGVWYYRNSDRRGTRDESETDTPYADGMTLHADGRIEGAGKDPKATLKLRRKVAAFAKDYIAAFCAGKVPAPGAGDCFYCGMVVADGADKGKPLGEATKDHEHILSHLEERYFVPSLLSRALVVSGASQITRQWVAAHWDASAPVDEARKVRETGFYREHGSEMARKMLRKYMLRQLGEAA